MPSEHSKRISRELDESKHALYGLEQYHGYVGKWSKIGYSGSVKELIRDRALELAKARHPHGVALFALTKKTRISTGRQLEARALYAILTEFLQGRTIDARQRKSLHRIRDELVEWWKQADRFGEVDYHGRTIDVELLKTPIDVDDPTLERAKARTDDPAGGFQCDQLELEA